MELLELLAYSLTVFGFLAGGWLGWLVGGNFGAVIGCPERFRIKCGRFSDEKRGQTMSEGLPLLN